MSAKILGVLNFSDEKLDHEEVYVRLNRLNGIAGVLHAFLVLIIIVMAATVGVPYSGTVSTVFKSTNTSLLDPAYLTPVCNGTTYDNFFSWADCLEEEGVELPDENGPAFAPVETVLFEAVVWPLLLIYEIITSASHFFLFFHSEVYEYFLSRQMQPFRWLEYSITSSIMTVIILELSGVVDVFLLMGFFALSASYNLLGGFFVEFIEASRNTLFEGAPRTLTALKVYFTAIAWFAFILTFVLIFYAVSESLGPLFDLDSADLWRRLYNFIVILDVILLFLYAVFPMIQLVQLKNAGNVDVYLRCEKRYIWLSFIAKTVLTLTILISATMRNDQENDA